MLNGLTQTQQKIVRDLKNPNYYIEAAIDFRDFKEEFTICDDDMNSYYSIKRITFLKLLDKKLIKRTETMGSLDHEVSKFRLKTI